MSVVLVVHHVTQSRVPEIDIQAIEIAFPQIVGTRANELPPGFHVGQELGNLGSGEVGTAHGQHCVHVLIGLLEVVETLVPGFVSTGGGWLALESRNSNFTSIIKRIF